jgi:hypothetical protein
MVELIASAFPCSLSGQSRVPRQHVLSGEVGQRFGWRPGRRLHDFGSHHEPEPDGHWITSQVSPVTPIWAHCSPVRERAKDEQTGLSELDVDPGLRVVAPRLTVGQQPEDRWHGEHEDE